MFSLINPTCNAEPRVRVQTQRPSNIHITVKYTTDCSGSHLDAPLMCRQERHAVSEAATLDLMKSVCVCVRVCVCVCVCVCAISELIISACVALNPKDPLVRAVQRGQMDRSLVPPHSLPLSL